MIKDSEITEAGKFNKPHGIKGEISVTVDADIALDEIKCVIIPVDGIYVPFFIESVRTKTADTFLVTIDGADSEGKAQYFTNRTFYILNSDLPETEIDDDDDGFYASDLIGYTIVDDTNRTIGTVNDINDTTQNVLFVVTATDGSELFVPVADEFIIGIDVEAKTISMQLPEGILNLNSNS